MINITDCLINENNEDIIFEWWNNYKKLTIYFNKESFQVDYIKVWGHDPENQMQEGSIKSIKSFSLIFSWLNNDRI